MEQNGKGQALTEIQIQQHFQQVARQFILRNPQVSILDLATQLARMEAVNQEFFQVNQQMSQRINETIHINQTMLLNWLVDKGYLESAEKAEAVYS